MCDTAYGEIQRVGGGGDLLAAAPGTVAEPACEGRLWYDPHTDLVEDGHDNAGEGAQFGNQPVAFGGHFGFAELPFLLCRLEEEVVDPERQAVDEDAVAAGSRRLPLLKQAVNFIPPGTGSGKRQLTL